MKRVMVYMSSTSIHHEHMRLLKKVSQYGKVIVGLTTDEEILIKQGYIPELEFEYRKEIFEAIKYVDEVVPTPWFITNETLEEYHIDLLVNNSDNSKDIDKDKLLVFPKSNTEIIKIKENDIYNIWNEVKKEVSCINKKILFEERDIVFLKMGKNIGFEEDGKGKEFLRPVLIVKKFNSNQFIGFAMTSKKPKEQNMKYYYRLKDDSYVILSQVRTYSVKRIKYNSHKINKRHIKEINEKFYKLFTPSD